MRENRSFSFDLRSADEDQGEMILKGHASVFNQKTRLYGKTFEQIERGAFSEVLSDDCYALFNHDPNLVLASVKSKTLDLVEDEMGLLATIKVANTSFGRDVFNLIKSGVIRKMSFGFQVRQQDIQQHFFEDSKETLVIIKKVSRLYDVSPVTYPAYEGTDISAEMRAFIDKDPFAYLELKKNKLAIDLEKIEAEKKQIDLLSRKKII